MALFSSPKTNAAATPSYTGMQLQSSAYGLCVPVIYGTTRVGWNLLDYFGFKQVSTPQSSGGKGGIIGGGGGKGGKSSTTTYFANVLGLLCEGPIGGVYSSWLSQTQQVSTGSYDFLSGAVAQAPWASASHVIGYSGFAYMAGANIDLGTSANLPAMNWEVEGILQGTAPGTYGGSGCRSGGDADPSQVVPDMLSNAQYGVGFPGTRVGQVVNNDESRTGATSITVNNAASFQYNLSVLDVTSGTLLTCVGSSPAAGQYSFTSAGVYTFNSAQTGHTLHIRYVSTAVMSNYQNFCLAAGLWISPAYSTQASMSSCIDDIAKATFSEVIWSSGVLQMIPRGTTAITAHGYTFTPNTTPLFNLTDDDFMANSGAPAASPRQGSGSTGGGNGTDDPIQIVRGRKSDQINDIKIECLDRANQYAPFVAQATDMGLINRYGRRAASSKSLHLFSDTTAASTSANFQLQDQYIQNLYCFQLDQRYALLDPMDLVTVTDPNFSGVSLQGVRTYDLTENDDGSVTVSAEEFPGTVGKVPTYNLDTSDGYIQDFDVDPGDAAAPAMFDVPVQLSDVIGLETWLATHSNTGNLNWGGCDIYLSTDGTSYFKRGTLTSASRMGQLTAVLASGSDPDTTHTLSVNLSQAFGVLEGGTLADANNGVTLCFVDGEYISYEQATLTSTYNYDLGKHGGTAGLLRRGLWGSPISSHAIGSLFVRLDQNVFVMPYTKADVGQTIYVKLVSFNIFGGGYQDISTVTPYTHVIGGPPTFYAPTGLTVAPQLKALYLNWDDAPDIGIAGTEIWRSTTSSFGGATHIDNTASYSSMYIDQNVVAGTQYWYWIRHFDIAGNTSNYYPSTGGAGINGTAAQVVTADVGNAQITAAKIDPAAIPAILLAASLDTVQVVTSLPASNAVSNVCFLTTDNNLYRWQQPSGPWIRSVNGADLTSYSVIGSKIAIADTTNICTNPDFVDGNGVMSADGWAASGGGAFNAYDDGASFVANGWPNRYLAQQSCRDVFYGQLFPCSTQESYYVSAFLSNQTAYNVSIGMRFLDASLSTISFQQAAIIATGLTTPTQYTGQCVSPGGTRWAQIWMNIGAFSAFGNFFYTHVTVRKAASAELLVDGSITANRMTTNSVTAGTIAAGAINASAIIVTNIIVTGHLTANTVSNGAAANVISGNNISVGLTPDATYPGQVVVFGGGQIVGGSASIALQNLTTGYVFQAVTLSSGSAFGLMGLDVSYTPGVTQTYDLQCFGAGIFSTATVYAQELKR